MTRTKNNYLNLTHSLRAYLVPLMLFTSSLIMAFAWLGHLKFSEFPLVWATLCCWLLVLPEYFLNISAMRLGREIYSGAQMAAFNLSSGVICVALVSRLLLGEDLSGRKLLGLGLMILSMALIARKPHTQEATPVKVNQGIISKL
ncbi:MAG: DMT family protein [Cyanobacteria bacterium J06621_8]